MGEEVEVKSGRLGRWWVSLGFKRKERDFTNIKGWRVGWEVCGDEPDFVYVKWTVFTPLR